MSTTSLPEIRTVSITRPSSIKLPPLPAVNYPYYHQSDGNSGFLRAARAGNVEKVLEYLRSSIDINTSNANGLNALHLASKEGHVHIVQELLSRGANVNAATKKGNTALHIASLAGQEEVVKLLVKYNANINCQSQNGFSPLYMAAQENHLEVVKFLLANGANQSLATEDGFTPLAVSLQQGHDKVVAILLENDSKGSKVRLPALHIAAKKNDTKAAALLLQGDSQPDLNYKAGSGGAGGGFVNCTTKSGFTPLHIAAHYGNLEVAQLLITRGADVNYAASQNITPLHVASKWGKDNLVKLLLEKGAQIDSKTKDGLTPLHCAARSGHDQVVDLLLESGAPFGAKTKNGLSALHMAAQGDHVDAARILLYYKSTLVDDVSSDYLSALHVASHCGNYNVAKLLCERRADVNAKALNGFSCLHIACKKNRLKLVELLISNDADVEAKTESGLTSLHVAAFVGSHDIVIYLLQHGAIIDAVTIRGETPLHLATRNNQIEIVQTLLRYGATVDAKAKEAQTCLHLATRLGNIEIVNLLLKSNAFVDNETKDGYSSLHIAAKEGHEEIASLLIDHKANLNLFTKRNFSALHICSKYGNIKVANLLLQKGATPDIQGKNDLTPLHCAVHYNHSNIALLLLQHRASPHVTARNGYTPLHIAAKKNALDIAEMLLEYNANTNAQSTGGFTPLHLSCQDGHSDMTYLLLANHADPNIASKCHLTPLHLCAQEDRVKCAEALVNKNVDTDAQTLSGYTSLHVACHFGQINMVRYLLQLGANVNVETNLMFTPLHSAAQQGHVMIVKLLLENGASPNKTNKHGMTALSIAQRLGYISVVEELKVVTETTIASKHELITEERYKIQAPEVSHEEHPLTDSEDETDMLGDASSNVHMQYLREGVLMTEAEENKLNQTSFTKEEPEYPMLAGKDHWTESRDNLHDQQTAIISTQSFVADNETITKPRHGGERFQYRSFLVSFLVDARGGAMRGCRHSGVRVIIPPKRASMPTRITCRFVKREKLTIPPPLNEGEALAARVLEVGPVACKFLGPVILEIPHFASLRNREREIVVLRSDNGEKWTEHTGPITDDSVREVFGETVDSEDLENTEELQSRRITRIITNDFPRFYALITRTRQEAHFIDEQGGLLTSSIIPTVQAHIPEKALQKRIRVALHVLPIPSQLVQRSYGSRVNVSPVVTVEPRRRKFHKPITITIPLPTKTPSARKHSHSQQHGNAYTSDSQTLRLLCSITGGTHAAQFDDITGHTPLTFSHDCATFTTTVSARFWLIDAQGIPDIIKLAHEIYREATSVPYMSRFIVFAKRHDVNEALVRIFCITDDKENKTLEMQEHFTEIAKSKEVEVVNGNSIYIDLQSNNLQTIIKTNEQLTLIFRAFKENRLPCVVRIRDQEQESSGRLIFSKDNGKLTSIQRTTSITMTNGQASALSSTTIIDPLTLQTICNLNIVVPVYDKDLLESEERLRVLHATERDNHSESWKSDDMYRKGEIRLTDIARLLGSDWPALAAELELSEEEVTKIMDEFGENASLQMLRYWLKSRGPDATGNCLQQALRKIGKENIVHNCVFNIEWVTDAAEKELAKARLNSRGGSVDGTAISGRRLDEGFESDDEYERRRHGKSNLLTDDPNRTPTTTIIKTITFEESGEDELGGKKSTNETVTPQFKQLEPLKMVKRDQSKEFLPSSSSTSSADTIVPVAMKKSLGERDGPLHFVDSSKAPTPASRYGGYHSKNYSGAITPLNSYSHPFELMHLESLREKLNRLSHDKVDIDDPYGAVPKQRSTDMSEGRKTPTASSEFPSRKSSSKLGDFGIVNIVQEITPIESTEQITEPTTSQMIDDLPPTRVNQTPVGERFIKSKIIPDQARALANAFKHAIVKPFKNTLVKKNSFDTNEQQLSISNPPSNLIENPDQQLNELSNDSYESTSPIPLTPPAKPPRHNDESSSSSSIEINSPPPAKPPRHFSLYRKEKHEDLMQQTDAVLKKVLNLVDTFGTNPNIETFTVQPTRIAMNTDVSSRTKTFDNKTDRPLSITSLPSSDDGVPTEIIQLARDLTDNILQNLDKEFEKHILFDKLSQLEQQQQQQKTSRDNPPSFPHPVVTTHITPTHSTTRPLMFVSYDTKKPVSPLLDIVTIKSKPSFITSVTVSSPPQPVVSSITTITNSDDDLNSTSTLIPNSSQSSHRPNLLQTSSKQGSLDSIDNTLYDNTVFQTQNTGNATPVHSLLSDYDNLHGSYGSLNDDNHPAQIISPPLPSSSEKTSSTVSSSTTTIYESLDNYPSLSSSATSPTYASAVSTFNTGGTTTPQRLNSDISDDDFIQSVNIDRSSQASTPIIEIIEDTSEPVDECDMTYLMDVLAQYNHQDNLETTNIQSSINTEATLAGKGEEPPSPSSSPSEASLLLISSPPPSFSSFPTSYIITKTSSKYSSTMPSKNSSIPLQHINKTPSTITNLDEDNSINNKQQEKTDYPIGLQSPVHQRRLPLPNKLTFEQNLTNLIEKESPLLQSELLTAEHELSVFRSRLAVNEGVTAVTGSILESLKTQFETYHKVDSSTSPINLGSPDSVEIHYDAESPKSPYYVVKTKNSFYIAQPIDDSEVEKHLKSFSSPVMKRATLRLPDTDSDSDDHPLANVSGSINIDKENKSNYSISEEDVSSIIDREEQLSEMKTIRASSLLQHEDQFFEKFENKIEEIYLIIDYLKHHKLTSTILSKLQKQINDLKGLMHNIHLNKQDELRIEYELDELENIFNKKSKQQDYNFIELFEQNLNELQHIIEQIKTSYSKLQPDLVTDFQHKLESIQNVSKKPRLIPEDPVVTSDVFFQGDKTSKIRKPSTSKMIRLIPEDARISAESFYEGDIHRSLYQHSDHETENVHEKKALIPETPLVSKEVFYEGDPQRSMFVERASPSQPISIDNLREIMGDLMLAASWSKKPILEIVAESFITTEESKSSLCEITHEIENFPLTHPSILIEEQDIDRPSPVVSRIQRSNIISKTITSNHDEPEQDEELLYDTAVQLVNNVIEHILTKYDNELRLIESSTDNSDEEHDISEEDLSSSLSEDDEENEKLIPQISDQPYLFVHDVVTSKSTQELGNLVQELQVLQHQMHDIHPLSSSSSSSSSSLSEHDHIQLSIPQIITTKSVNELTNLVSELQSIEDQLEDRLDSPNQTEKPPVSSKSFNELGGLINELHSVSKQLNNRIQEELFTSTNIDSLSQDIVKYRRDSLTSNPIEYESHKKERRPSSPPSSPVLKQDFLNMTRTSLNDIDEVRDQLEYEQIENQLVKDMIDNIIKQAQNIILTESLSQTTVKSVPTITIDQRRLSHQHISQTSISDDLDLSHDDNTDEKVFELAAQLDYLRRMSRYENLMDTQELSINISKQSPSEEEIFIESNPRKESISTQQHFQSAYDLHDEEKSKLVRSPELYNMDNVIKHDHHPSLTSSQIQYRTLSESALATDDSKRHSLTTTTSNDASIEFLTTLSKDNSLEIMYQRLPTPFDDVLEKESSPEHSESYNIPTSAFSDTLEPTSSCQRPLAFHIPGQERIITDEEYNKVADDLVNQVLIDVVIELTGEQEDSSLSNKLSISSTSSSDDDDDDGDELPDEDEHEDNQYLIDNSSNPSERKPSTRSSLSKTLRRAQTDTKHFDIAQSPITLIPPILRRNSQSDTETYFRGVSSITDYTQIENHSDNSSSDDKKEKYSGESEESNGGKQRNIQRRKRSNDITNNYDSPSIKTHSFKFELNESNIKRQESLDSPSIDSNEKSILKSLQQGILRTNLESFQNDYKLINQEKDHSDEKTYSSTARKSISLYDYDAGSETDRDDSKRILQKYPSTIDNDIKNLLEDLISSINTDLSISISNELLSSNSDATTVIFVSNKTSMDEEDNLELNSNQHCLPIPTSSSSSSSSHSVIYNQIPQNKSNLTTSVNTNSRKQSSIPSFSNNEFIGYNIKKKFLSYPGSLGGTHIPPSPITSISNDYYSMATTSITLQSGKQHFDE